MNQEWVDFSLGDGSTLPDFQVHHLDGTRGKMAVQLVKPVSKRWLSRQNQLLGSSYGSLREQVSEISHILAWDLLVDASLPFVHCQHKWIVYLQVSMPSSSSSATGLSYDLSIAALKLSLHPLPRIIRGLGRWKGMSPFKVTSATAVWRLSNELDFFRPNEGPTSRVGEPLVVLKKS